MNKSIRVNLLPHRERKREQKIRDFYVWGIFFAIIGFSVAFLCFTFIDSQVMEQEERNRFLKSKIDVLDKDVSQISSLRADVRLLSSRQKSVEILQVNRNVPIFLFDELARNIPDGIFLTSIIQNDKTVKISGVAQSNERVSELFYNLDKKTKWIGKPELVEISSNLLENSNSVKNLNISIKNKGSGESYRVSEFSIRALLLNLEPDTATNDSNKSEKQGR